MCNFIHLMLLRNQICECHKMLMMNKFKIMKTDSLTVMLQMLNNVIKAIAIFCLSNANTENSV